MLKKTLIVLMLPLVSLLGSSSGNYAAQLSQKTSDAPTGTLQKMIVENGSVTMDLDLNGLNASGSLVARPITLHFLIGANSFFPILVFNDLLRGPEPGSMALIPGGINAVEAAVPAAPTSVLQATPLPLQNLPAAMGASPKQLVIEKLNSTGRFGL